MRLPAHRERLGWVPGAALLSPAGFGSALLIVWNDLWLKRHHPGLVSGKLSDVGLCIFLPLFIAAALEWGDAARLLLRRDAVRLRSASVQIAACVIAVAYFGAIKCWPAATHAHVAWLSFVAPSWRFRAVTDPTDLLCLPAVVLAWRAMSSAAPSAFTSPRRLQRLPIAR